MNSANLSISEAIPATTEEGPHLSEYMTSTAVLKNKSNLHEMPVRYFM